MTGDLRVSGGITPSPINRLDNETSPARIAARDTSPPPVTAKLAEPTDRPTLALPQATSDATDLLLAALALKLKAGDEQVKTSTQEVQFNGQVQKSKNDEIAKNLQDQLDKMQESKDLGGFLKALQWIGVALAVVVAAVTLNPVAIAGAVMAVTMAVLNETGVMDKMTEAIANSLEKGGMSASDARKWAMGISMGLTIAVSIATLGGGAAASASNVAAKAAQLAAKFGDVASKAATVAKISQAVTGIAQAGTGIAKGVVDKDVAEKSAEVAEIKAFLAKIMASMDDETDRIQVMLQQSQEVVSRAMKALQGVSETNSNIIRQMA